MQIEYSKAAVEAWDPDFTKLTDEEEAALTAAEEEMQRGECFSHDEIDWNA